jgi:hypothetical protein
VKPLLKSMAGVWADAAEEIAVAVYGLSGLGLIAFRAQNLLTGGRLRGFAGRPEALLWLLQQGTGS